MLLSLVLIGIAVTDIFILKQYNFTIDMSFIGIVLGLSILLEKNLYLTIGKIKVVVLAFISMYLPDKLFQYLDIEIIKIPNNIYLLLVVFSFIVIILYFYGEYKFKGKRQ